MAAVVIRLAGGLGNQLFQYAAGLALAEARRARLLLDLSLYRNDKLRTYNLDAFALEPKFVPKPWSAMMGAFDRKFVGRAIKTMMPAVGWHYVFDGCQGYDSSDFPAGANLVLQGYWQSENYFAGVADRVRTAFRFRDPPDEANAACLDRIAA